MNRTQRKYAMDRLLELKRNKINEISKAFEARLENRLKPMVNLNLPDDRDILLSILEWEGRKIELFPKAEMISIVRNHVTSRYGSPVSLLSKLAPAINTRDVEEVAAYNAAILDRREIEVNQRIARLNAECRRYEDSITLATEDAALDAINSMETMLNCI